ncbi:DUF4468 domain-containing protein [Spirosoma panaciterrae]|uniref:DUF4468 domain-containing protein n=1 Tax=Spirosoma panaciterrae TaxID=496058 RepID=UPI000476701D|nr:DUF4468 domain-containing protein [Spirosoma panaciterrae]
MKYLLILTLCVCIRAVAVAQVRLPNNEAGQVQYQEIIKVPNPKTPARQLMEQFHEWADAYYASDPTAEQQYDQEHNILFVKSMYKMNEQRIRYTLTLEAKYGRYRATLTDLIAESNGLNTPIRATSTTVSEMEHSAAGKTTTRKVIEQTVQQQTELYQEIDKACRETLASLREAMLTEKK